MDKYREQELGRIVADILNKQEDREKALEALRVAGLSNEEMEDVLSRVFIYSCDEGTPTVVTPYDERSWHAEPESARRELSDFLYSFLDSDDESVVENAKEAREELRDMPLTHIETRSFELSPGTELTIERMSAASALSEIYGDFFPENPDAPESLDDPEKDARTLLDYLRLKFLNDASAFLEVWAPHKNRFMKLVWGMEDTLDGPGQVWELDPAVCPKPLPMKMSRQQFYDIIRHLKEGPGFTPWMKIEGELENMKMTDITSGIFFQYLRLKTERDGFVELFVPELHRTVKLVHRPGDDVHENFLYDKETGWIFSDGPVNDDSRLYSAVRHMMETPAGEFDPYLKLFFPDNSDAPSLWDVACAEVKRGRLRAEPKKKAGPRP